MPGPGGTRASLRLLVVLASCGLAFSTTAHANHGLADLGSIGQINGNGAFDVQGDVSISADGSVVVFSTSERLVSSDTDNALDVYQRVSGVTSLVSAGAINGNGAFDASYNNMSLDGARIFFRTQERLVGADTDDAFDLYQRFNGTTTLLSVGTTTDCPVSCNFAVSTSDDGTRVYFLTHDSLAITDTDSAVDLYEASGGTTTHVSQGEINGNGALDVNPSGNNSDGSRVFFTTFEQLEDDDDDVTPDFYERSAGTTTLVSGGLNPPGSEAVGDGFVTPSTDGTHVFFATPQALVGTDTDTTFDWFDRTGGVTIHVTQGEINGNGSGDANSTFAPFFGISGDGSRAFFNTGEQLVEEDDDNARDAYERSGGTTKLVSEGQINGDGPNDATVRAISADGEEAFFHTSEPLVSADTDSSVDIYERSGGTTKLVSAGQTGGNGAFDVGVFFPVSADGSRVFFRTQEKLVSADTDNSFDVYERFGGTTTLISRGQRGGNGAFDVTLLQTISGSPTPQLTGRATVPFLTNDRLACADTDSSQDLYVGRVGSGPSVGCPIVSTPPVVPPPKPAAPADGGLRDLVLCGRRDISLVRADPSGRRVIVSGLVSTRLQNTPITIHGTYGGKTRKLATVRAKADGSFQTRVKGPSKRQFAKARLQARAGTNRSARLKLPQSLASSSVRASGGTITLKGKIQRSLVGKRNRVTIKRLLCGRLETVGSAKPSRSGAYTVRFKAPAGATAALYRAEARVLSKPRSKRYVKQFARAIGIALTGQTG